MQIGQVNNILNAKRLNGAPPAHPPKKAPKTPDEIAAFMRKLGLTPTNSKEGDDAAIKAKLAELEAAAKTDAEKQNVKDLAAEFSQVVSSLQPPAGGPPPPQADNFAGMEQLGALNKHFLVK